MKSKYPVVAFAAIIVVAFVSLSDAQIAGLPVAGTHPSVSVRVPRGMAGRISATSLGNRARASLASQQYATPSGGLSISTQNFPPGSLDVSNTLPLWTFDIVSSRDGDHHQGVMVGHDPFTRAGTAQIPTFIVPLIFRTHVVVTSVDPNTLMFATTVPGETTLDPTQADNTCMTAPNNLPVRVFEQSPLFHAPSQAFVLNGTPVGATQYVDAFQRSNF